MNTEEIINQLYDNWDCGVGPHEKFGGLMARPKHWNREVANLILQLKNVRVLHFNLASADIDAIDDLGQLTDIRSSRIGIKKEMSFDFVKNWTQLEVLHIGIPVKQKERVPIHSQDFQNCNKIREIDLSGIELTSDDFKWIANHQKLRKISFDRTQLSGEIIRLAECKSLNSLSLRNSKLLGPPSNLSFVRDSKISFLGLSSTNIGDEHLEVLTNSRSIQELQIYETKVTDAGLKHLTMLPELSKLNVDVESLTLEGIKHLSNCSNLKELEVFSLGRPVDEKIVKQLDASLTDCDIYI